MVVVHVLQEMGEDAVAVVIIEPVGNFCLICTNVFRIMGQPISSCCLTVVCDVTL